MNKFFLVALMFALGITACSENNPESDEGSHNHDTEQQQQTDSHDHGDGEHSHHDDHEHVPQTEAYYGDDAEVEAPVEPTPEPTDAAPQTHSHGDGEHEHHH